MKIRARIWRGSLPFLIVGVAVTGVLLSIDAWAAGPKKKTTVTTTTTTTTTSSALASAQQRLDALSGQVSNLATQQNDTQSEVKKIEKEMTVATPAEGAKPTTIGEHVGTVENDVAAIRKDLSENLGIHVHGLVDAGYEHNFNQPINNVNVFRAWDEDGFQLTQGLIHIDRTKEGGVGFVTDLNFGQVANSISSVTNYSNVSHVGGQWFDPTQYYLTYTVPVGTGLNIQGGRFVTLLGAEVIPTYSNQNYNETRSFIFNNGEPLTHTGFRGNYVFNDYVAFTGGVNNGWDDPAAFNNGGPNYEGEIALNTLDKSLGLLLNGIWGPNLPGHSNSNLGAIDPVLTWKPTFLTGVTLAAEYLYASESGPVINGHSASWQGAAGYFVYDWTDWEFASRGEFFDDMDGARTNGTAQTLWELTQTVTYHVPEVTGLLARLEYRHDNSNSQPFTNNNFVNPVTGLQRTWAGQDTLSGNMIYAF